MDRVSVVDVTPKVKYLLGTSVLLPVEAPKETVGAASDAAGRPNVNMSFFSGGAGGVLGAAPNENSVFGLLSASLRAWPNENGVLEVVVTEGCVVIDEMLGMTGVAMGAKAEPSLGIAVVVGSTGFDPVVVVMLDAGGEV